MATDPFRGGLFEADFEVAVRLPRGDDEDVVFRDDPAEDSRAVPVERPAEPLTVRVAALAFVPLLALLLAVLLDVLLELLLELLLDVLFGSASRASPPVVERAAVRAAVRMATSPATPAREPLDVLAVAVRPSPLGVLDPFRRLEVFAFEVRVLVFFFATEISSILQGPRNGRVGRVSPSPRNPRP